jgi:hypothetical protein
MDIQDREPQRGAHSRCCSEVHVGAVVSQQPEDIGVVVQRSHERRREALRVGVLHAGVARALK